MTVAYILAGIAVVIGIGLWISKSNKAPQEHIGGNPIVDNPTKPEEPIEAN